MDRIITNIRNNDKLRASFNELVQKTFCFNFENWYNKGLWGDKYIPHVIVRDNKVVANVSVNIMDFMEDGVLRHYIQLGTVMTDKDYRHQGLCRKIMEYIIDSYLPKCDGMYLFGNDSVLEFYPRFGFVTGKEYHYTKKVEEVNTCTTAIEVEMTKENLDRVFDYYQNSACNDRFAFRNNSGLLGFYIAQFSKTYYLPKEDAYVVAQYEEKTLVLHQIISKHIVPLDNVLNAFGGYERVSLAFVPLDAAGYDMSEFKEEDCTFFYQGDNLKVVMEKKFRFPSLSHA